MTARAATAFAALLLLVLALAGPSAARAAGERQREGKQCLHAGTPGGPAHATPARSK